MARLLALVLAASSATASTAPLPKIVVLSIKPIDDDSRKTAEVLTEVLLTDISRLHHFDVLGETDINSMLGFERQKQLMGCSDQAGTCMTEIASALGATYLLVSSLGRVGTQLRVDMKLIDTHHGTVLGRDGAVIPSERMVSTTCGAVLRSVMSATVTPTEVARADLPDMSVVTAEARPRWTLRTTTMMVAGVLAAGAGAFLVENSGNYNSSKQTLTFNQAQTARNNAVLQQDAGAALLIAGGVAAGAGLVLFSYDRWLAPDAPSLALVPTGTGAALTGHF